MWIDSNSTKAWFPGPHQSAPFGSDIIFCKFEVESGNHAQRSKKLVYELKRGTKLDGKENIRSKMITWLRSRDCDDINDDPDVILERSIQETIVRIHSILVE